jgi:hypothetical protein
MFPPPVPAWSLFLEVKDFSVSLAPVPCGTFFDDSSGLTLFGLEKNVYCILGNFFADSDLLRSFGSANPLFFSPLPDSGSRLFYGPNFDLPFPRGDPISSAGELL